MSFVVELTSCPNHYYLAPILIIILTRTLCDSFLTASLFLSQVIYQEMSYLSHEAYIRRNT